MDCSKEQGQELVLGKSFVNCENKEEHVSSCILRYEFCPASVKDCVQGSLSWEPNGTVALDFYKQGENGEPSAPPASLSGRLATSDGQAKRNEPTTSDQTYILIQEDSYWRLEKVDISVVHLRPFRSSQKAANKPNTSYTGESPSSSNKSTPVLHVRTASCSPANRLTENTPSKSKS